MNRETSHDNEINLYQIDTHSEPPAEEPARQYYFMAKCRQIVKAESERLGRPLSACTQTFGCQMNPASEIRKTA